jgi:hypothetical protein
MTTTTPHLPTWRELIAQENEVREILRARMRRAATTATPEAAMSPNLRVIAGPCVTPIIGGDVARVVILPDGTGRIEWWVKGVGWTEAPKGAFTLYEMMPGKCRAVLEKDAARLGCRLEDFGRHWTEERASTADRVRIIGALKNRAWDLACRGVAPGHA